MQLLLLSTACFVLFPSPHSLSQLCVGQERTRIPPPHFARFQPGSGTIVAPVAGPQGTGGIRVVTKMVILPLPD